MNILYNKLKKYTLKDAIELEELDRQFIALKKLEKNISDKELYFSLIIANSLICYQLSGKGENYWEEFSEYYIKNFPPLSKKRVRGELGKTVVESLYNFFENSKNNKRFVDTKKKRLEKIRNFIENVFYGKSEYFYKNMTELRNILAKTMKQKIDAKTIVFAIKMFGYGARNIYSFLEYPKEIFIPIDSRLDALYEKYKNPLAPLSGGINQFYSELSEKLNIPILHFDAIVWTLYDKLIKDDT